MTTDSTIHHIIVPGYGNSGAEHWQTCWQRRLPNSRRTQPASWDFPEHDDWIAALDREITATEGPIILIAHSLGTITVAEWASKHPSDRIIGALLVAIPDVQRPDLPDAIQGFAKQLGARIEILGACGHINHESGLGEWEEGLKWLDELGATAARHHAIQATAD